MASISPVPAIDLDILLNIQQAEMATNIAIIYGGISIGSSEVKKHIAKIIDSEKETNTKVAKIGISCF